MSALSDPFVDGANDNASREGLRRRIHSELGDSVDVNNLHLATPGKGSSTRYVLGRN